MSRRKRQYTRHDRIHAPRRWRRPLQDAALTALAAILVYMGLVILAGL